MSTAEVTKWDRALHEREKQRLAHLDELAALLAYISGDHWNVLGPEDRHRYQELAQCAFDFCDYYPRPPTAAPAVTTVADVEAAVRRIVGAKPLGKWLLERLHDELGKKAPKA